MKEERPIWTRGMEMIRWALEESALEQFKVEESFRLWAGRNELPPNPDGGPTI